MKKSHISIAGALLAVTALATSRVVAQQASSSGVPAHMVVTVEPRHGSNVPVINREDVMVYQGHDRAKVTDWLPLQGEHAGLQLFILIDDAANLMSTPPLKTRSARESSFTRSTRPARATLATVSGV